MKNEAGTTSHEVRWCQKNEAGRYEFCETELPTREEALHSVETVLRTGVEQVTVIKWRHEHNLPNALPPVVAKSCSMDVFELVDGKVVEKAIDIFGRAY